MRIGYFGGSFDPPHNGHLAVARAAASAFQLDRILLAPVAHQPLKPAGAAAPWPDRLAMVQLLCQADPRLSACTADAPLPAAAPNFTVDTLIRLRAEHPTTQLFTLVGADAFLTLPHWRQPHRLLELSDWIVVSRPHFPRERLSELALTSAQLARVHWLEGVHDPTSATELRTLLCAHPSTDPTTEAQLLHMLPSAVLAYIRRHGLYSTGTAPQF